ncbi:Integrase, catalytic core protein [Phytophthora megakarya]|uniref:Integrase, catalytic core protein n=1 Tax=Phytophthora megakarya TaxID=4795 RepID=A0A225VTE5_9STRA|nr:Integrase, catalytic core protein [Phytophthora megakarya]
MSQKTPNPLAPGGYALKTDRQGYVTRFKSRIVSFGNHQRPGIDIYETFAPVAGMSSFRMLVALAPVLHLRLYGGDINTAYLNALLGIRQYLKTIDGFPCATKGHMADDHVGANYVDDIMAATNSEEHKCKLFEKLDEMYDIKDQGLLTEYLGMR